VCSYKPVKLSALIEPLKLDFEALVRETFSNLDNKQFLENVEVITVCQQMLLFWFLPVMYYFCVRFLYYLVTLLEPNLFCGEKCQFSQLVFGEC